MKAISMKFDEKPTQKQHEDPFLQFAAAIAHEVRNPLSSIDLSIELLESSLVDANQKIYLEIIHRSSARINELITELLKGQNQDGAIQVCCSIHQILEEVIEMNRDRIRLKNINVHKDYAGGDDLVMVDPPSMKIALANIVLNSIEAMKQEKGELSLTTKLMDELVILRIDDNGCGISKENMKYISKANFTTKPKGLGLGLALTHEILRGNKVKARVNSSEGVGTCFTLLIGKRLFSRKSTTINSPAGLQIDDRPRKERILASAISPEGRLGLMV